MSILRLFNPNTCRIIYKKVGQLRKCQNPYCSYIDGRDDPISTISPTRSLSKGKPWHSSRHYTAVHSYSTTLLAYSGLRVIGNENRIRNVDESYRSYHTLGNCDYVSANQRHIHARLTGNGSSPKYADSWIRSFSETELTDGVVEVPFYHDLTPDQLVELGFSKQQRNAKFTVLCSNITSPHPEIIAVRKDVPRSDTIYHVKRVHSFGIHFNSELDGVLNSDIYKNNARFIGLTGNHLELDYDYGVYRPEKCTNKPALFPSIDGYEEYPDQIKREFNVIREAIEGGWPNAEGRNALYMFMSKALLVCDKYAVTLQEDDTFKEPIEIRNLGGGAYQTYVGSFTCNYARLGSDRSKLPDEMDKRRKFIEESFDQFDVAGYKGYMPDLQLVRRHSSENALDKSVYLTVEIKGMNSPTMDKNTLFQSWNQALVGLQHCSHTYALIMTLYEAKLYKIEILEDNTIFTSEKSYHFRKEGSNLYQTKALVEIFTDLVKIMWERKVKVFDF